MENFKRVQSKQNSVVNPHVPIPNLKNYQFSATLNHLYLHQLLPPHDDDDSIYSF